MAEYNLSKDTIFPSTRALLEAGISCREPGGKGWSIYWMEGGTELTLFPGSEGPQEASSIDEIIEWIGGDQPAVLTPASLRRFSTTDEVTTLLRLEYLRGQLRSESISYGELAELESLAAYINPDDVELLQAINPFEDDPATI